jgi:hypothetical protein
LTKKFKITVTTSGAYVITAADTSTLSESQDIAVPQDSFAKIVTSSSDVEYEEFLSNLNRRLWGEFDEAKERTLSEDDSASLTAP